MATGLAHRTAVVLDSGDLAQAVRASAAVPLLFEPELRDGVYLVDGGLSANIPVAAARAAGADRIIVSDATEHPSDSLDVTSPIRVADRLVQFLFEQPEDSLRGVDLLIRPAVEGYSSLNFSRRAIAGLLALGRAAADTTLPRLACVGRAQSRPTQKPPRLHQRHHGRRCQSIRASCTDEAPRPGQGRLVERFASLVACPESGGGVGGI